MLKTTPLKIIVAAALVLLALLTMSIEITADEPGTDTDVEDKTEALDDARYSWARDDIRSLAEQGAVIGYPDGSFKPNQPITRAELASMLSRALSIQASDGEPNMPYTDMADHWAQEYVASLRNHGFLDLSDGESFEPDKQVTRSEMIDIIMAVIPVDEKFGTLLEDVDSSFIDLTTADTLFKKVEASERLGIIPIHYGVAFEPNRTVTRAEAASMVHKLVSLDVIEGMITSADSSGTITVASEGARESQISVSNDTLTVRNGLAARPNTLKNGDVVYVVASESDAKFVHSFGELTQEDLLTRATGALKGMLTQEQIAALIRGDYEAVEQEITPKVKERLVDEGLSEEEADALISRNWDSLPGLLQERAVSSVSQQLGVPSELIVDTVQQKWDSVRSFAEQKLTEYVIAALAESDLPEGDLPAGSGEAGETGDAGASGSESAA